ncbi:MAG TPA: GMC family oxidoreductase N-terminal domain-containing protein [Kribbella sp.]|uniref:GMC family oxidoreductase n=1 Tax=Kribbella sp. TaxID=1871183 RepID=UPI002D77712D|nr:GMC family oxidoreductase N-terminal domain-containing protein [Kribbella sp.]HET6298189.1 GMC family oxidoreductase N-terminal domain-containing protein [Kribbella sp.]
MRSYEYVVVGAGTAGCVLAARLSEDGVRVLLLEAGDAQPLELMAVPPAWPSLMGSTADWADETVPQRATGTSVAWPRGRGLGGSSSINAMNFVRGHRAGYDAWAAAGAKGWGFDDLLPAFKRSEQTEGRDPVLRGLGGPLRPGPAVQRHPIAEAGLRAAEQAGFPMARDISGGVEEGFGFCDLSIVDGRRQSAADAYLTPAQNRPNLEVVTDALVSRLLMDGDRCRGVEYQVGAETFVAEGTAEVVLAAGTIGTPQLLMLSGIGPADHLDDLGIEVVADLPGVGANLHDHPMCGVVYQSRRSVPPGVNNHGEVQGLLSTGIGGHGPDVQLMVVDVPLRADSLPGPDIGDGYAIMVSLMAPYSRGSVRLASIDPGAHPVIDPAYYSDERDLDIVLAGLRIAREIGAAPALREWCGGEALPGPEMQAEEELRSYIKTNLRSYSHYAGTCAIGTDERSVVDTDLHVHGISNLRVADASVMPSPISANTNATVYAIAERAAELIRS